MVRVCERSIIFLCVCPSVRPSVLRPFVCHTISSLITGRNSTKRYITPLMVRVCESNIIFPCHRRASICPSRYFLLNHWPEFNLSCYMTSPMVRVLVSKSVLHAISNICNERGDLRWHPSTALSSVPFLTGDTSFMTLPVYFSIQQSSPEKRST